MTDWWQNQSQNLPGDPNCPHCEGHGVLPVDGSFPPAYKSCVCMHYKDILRNVERGFPGLIKAKRLATGRESKFKGQLDRNLWISAPYDWFKAHLRWIMVRQKPDFCFKLTSDSELMRAWLGTTHMRGINIIDPDAHLVSSRFMNLEDLVEPPSLLIIHLGVKKARNEASPEVLYEALKIRAFRGKPTWVYHDPTTDPMDQTMRSWSYEVHSFLESWNNHINIAPSRKTVANPKGQFLDVSDIPEPSPSKPRRITNTSPAHTTSSAPRKTDPAPETPADPAPEAPGSSLLGKLDQMTEDKPTGKKTNTKWKRKK